MTQKITVLFFSLFLASSSRAQAIDPIQIATQEPGKFSINLSLSFLPYGRQFIAPDNTLGIQQNYGFTLGISVAYAIEKRFGVSGTAVGVFQLSRVFFSGQDQISTLINAAGSVNFTYHLESDSPFDPTLSLGFSYPWVISAGVNARFIRDPVVIGGSLGISKPLTSDGILLNGSASVAFIANERITLAGQVSTEVPIGTLTFPISGLALRIGYTLNPDTLEEVGLSVTFSVSGDATRVGFSFDWNK